jgi:type VI secretion system protein ImpM
VTGYFGKVSTHGDFVTRRLPGRVVEAWDGWLQGCVQASRARLGAQWLQHYLSSPVWRFAVAPGVLGPEGLGGVMMPSVDRVGRYFPLMIGAAGSPPLFDWFRQQGAWYDAIEDLALESLDPAFTLARLDEAPEPELAPPLPSAAGWRFPLDADLNAVAAGAAFQGQSVWWSEGAPGIEASLLVCQGMPQAQAFAAMLDGSWQASGWQIAGT